MFPLDQIAHVGVSPSLNLKLISREIISNLCEEHTWTSQRDRRTDNLLWHNRAVKIAWS